LQTHDNKKPLSDSQLQFCNLMHFGIIRSYSFSIPLTRFDVLKALSHCIYYFKSQSLACKDPVWSQTTLQETSGNAGAACLITLQFLERMSHETAPTFAHNSSNSQKDNLNWDLHR